MALRTYGSKPKSFQIEENGEYYCMGSEVGNYLGFFRGTLYKRYPGMFRRSVTNEERKKLVKLGLNPYVPTSIVCLVRASEVEDIIKGNDHKYKTPPVHPTETHTSRKSTSKIPIPWVSTSPSSSRLDVVPQVASIDPIKVHNKTVRTLPSRLRHPGPSKNLGTAAQQQILIPIRSDEGIRENLTWNYSAKQDSREDFIGIGTAAENAEVAQSTAQFETTYNYDCRICLKNSDKFWEIFQTRNLPEKIMAIAFVQVQFGDGLPSVICYDCRQLLDMSYDFKCLVERSDAALRNALVSRMNVKQGTVRESSSQPDPIDYRTQCQSQWQSHQNLNPLVSNVTHSKQSLVAYEFDEESINTERLHEEEAGQRNRDNESENQRYIKQDDDSSEPEIIAISKGSKILRENPGGLVSTLSEVTHQSMGSESEQIKQEELFLPEEIDVLEGEDKQAHEIILTSDIKFELKNDSLLVGEEKGDDAWAGKLETSSIGEMNVGTDAKPLIASLSQQKCPHCILSFATNVDLQTHMIIHGGVNKLRYTCYWCEEQFSDIVTLMNHVSDNHHSSNNEERAGIADNSGELETTRGDKLDKKIGSLSEKRIVEKKNQELFLSHIGTHPEYERSQTSSGHSKQLENMRKSLNYQSDLFRSETNRSDDDDLHVEGLQCTQCQEPFATRGSLKRHISTHSHPRFSCSICRMEFLEPDKLKDHEQSDHQEEIFGSSEDEDDTDNESKPSDGTESRKKEKKCRPHLCPLCPKGFHKPQSLASHMERHKRINESQPQFFCEVCGKCFAQSESLAAHMRTHTWVQTYGTG